MADQESGSGEQPIIIKKIVKGGHGHHGGAWKVAYADFVTAMMAFFIVMWILSAGQEAKEEVAAYFNNPGAFSFVTGKRTIEYDTGLKPEPGRTPGTEKGDGAGKAQVIVRNPSKEEIMDGIRSQARSDSSKAARRVAETGQILKEFIDEVSSVRPDLENAAENIEIQLLDEGLRIELIESSDNTFFKVGSADLKSEVEELLEVLAFEIGKLPNFIELEGHTDARGYGNRKAKYTNWELSSDRANAARRVMVNNGLWDGQVLRVAGYADKFLRYPDQPFDPKNRRISILIKHLRVSDVMMQEEDIENAQDNQVSDPGF